MKITKIILDNITTHKRTTVNFTDGINVLSGLNGSGKSTVLKMIGYVLFDCISENQGDFVRTDTSGRSSSTGTVTVYFTGKDDVEYYVRRVIGGGNTMPRVCFADSGIEKTFAARGDVFSWIREQMAIDRMLDMKSLFQNAIGVDQGTFTMPFLETRARRRDIFGPILNVDVYKKAYDKHIEIQHTFDGEINAYTIQESGLLGEISQKGELISEKEGIQAEIAIMIEKARDVATGLESAKNDVKRMEANKAEVEKVRQAFQTKQTLLREREGILAIIDKNLAEARVAREKCNETTQDHDKHELLSRKEQELRVSESELAKIKEQLDGLEREHAVVSSEIASVNERIAAIEALKVTVASLKAGFDEYEAITNKIMNIKSLLDKLDRDTKQLVDLQRKRGELARKVEDCAVDEQQVATLEGSVKMIPDNEAELQSLISRIASIDARVSQARDNKEAASGGLCPFLHDHCKNIKEGSLDEHFQHEIDEYLEQRSEFAVQKDIVQARLESLRRDAKDLENMKGRKELAGTIMQQVADTDGEINALELAISSAADLHATFDRLTADRKKLEPVVDKYRTNKQKIDEELPALLHERQAKERRKILFEESISPLKKHAGKLPDVRAQLASIQADLGKTKAAHDTYNQNKVLAGKFNALDDEARAINGEVTRMKQHLQELGKTLADVEAKFDEKAFNDARARKDELTAENARLEATITGKRNRLSDIDARLVKIQERVDELEKVNNILNELKEIKDFSTSIRDWFKAAGPVITKALLATINSVANELFKQFLDEDAVRLEWKEDFDLVESTPQAQKSFSQLSGGEQMAAALAIRLAILRVLTNVDFAFFDEPTTNLDPQKRENLARCIKNIKGFKQLFVISHDDTFERYADHVVHFTKDADEITHVEQSGL